MSILLASLSLTASLDGTSAPQDADPLAQPRVLLTRKITAPPDRADVASNLVRTGDGAWIVGWTSKSGAPHDGLLLHVDGDGEVLARAELGGPGDDRLWAVRSNGDDGYVCVGTRAQDSGTDGWMIGLDRDGHVVWERTFGGSGDEWLTSLRATPEGWIAVGQTTSRGAGGLDAWVLRTDREGHELSSWTWGTPGVDRAFAIHPMSDGGCVIAGMSGASAEACDAFATRSSDKGEPLWTRLVARPGFDVAHDIEPCANGDLLVYGYSFVDASRDCDAFVRRISAAGDVVFERTFGGPSLDRALHARVFDDGSSVLIGHSRPQRSAVEDWDLAVYALDSDGHPRWTARFGSPDVEFGRGIAGTADDLWIVGHTATFDEKRSNVYLIRLDTRRG